MLELMLGQIANYCPIIFRNTIVKNSISIEFIWNAIHLHFGFQATGAHFVDFNNIKLQPDKRLEDLSQRLIAFVEDSLLSSSGNITHHNEQITEDEELSPTLENFVVLTWLRVINPALPNLIKQCYGTGLHSRTLASIKPEISQAVSSLLDEIASNDEAKVMCTQTFRRGPSRRLPVPAMRQSGSTRLCEKSCPLCKQASRPDNHFLSECRFLPERDWKYMAKARQIASILEDDEECFDDAAVEDYPHSNDVPEFPVPASRLVQVRQSPYINVLISHHTVRVTIDSGATCNMNRASTADGHSPLEVIGETRITFTREKYELCFEGLVVENLDVEILAGTPFMEANAISVRPARHTVLICDTSYTYGSNKTKSPAVRCAVVLIAPSTSTTIWPGEFIEIALPDGIPDNVYALEPRTDAPSA
ncbi:Hypothetical predicted protein [Paramuricea clavata]|uniref:Uncharacterized protein n=1 Tax=Paramuricea clavata TaxID=317549 RepID=A0A7D9E6Y6_PARCT|nr:Hypothetical predicted protein [Paramuricea clavata]